MWPPPNRPNRNATLQRMPAFWAHEAQRQRQGTTPTKGSPGTAALIRHVDRLKRQGGALPLNPPVSQSKACAYLPWHFTIHTCFDVCMYIHWSRYKFPALRYQGPRFAANWRGPQSVSLPGTRSCWEPCVVMLHESDVRTTSTRCRWPSPMVGMHVMYEYILE